jgi:hypothetical protein
MKLRLNLIIIALAFIPAFAFSQTNINYINIGYSSICCGPPSEKPVMDFMNYFEKEYKLKPFEIFMEDGLGKEGEYALYIGTDNLNTNLLSSFLDGLKITVYEQNKQRSKNHDGYVNLDTKLIPSFTLKNKQLKSRTK